MESSLYKTEKISVETLNITTLFSKKMQFGWSRGKTKKNNSEARKHMAASGG